MTYPITDVDMDEAVRRYRLLTPEQFRDAIATDPEFRFAINAAYKRGIKDPLKNFITYDRDGWNPVQFNVHVDPARPNEFDPFGPGAKGREKFLKPLPDAMLF